MTTMTTTDIPVISITSQNDSNEYSNNSTGDDYDNDIRDAHTDIEDFDSNDENSKNLENNSSVNLENKLQVKLLKNKSNSPAVTDIEDYHDSDTDDDKSFTVPDVKISLKEYLDSGHTKEETQLSGKITTSTMGGQVNQVAKKEFSNQLCVDLADDPGCVTDYENVDTSDDEIEEYGEMITSCNRNYEQGMCDTQEFQSENYLSKETITEMESAEGNNKRDYNEEDGACCLSSAASDVENMTVSEEDDHDTDDEEEQNNNKNIKYPIIDITFVPEHKNQKRKFSDRSCSPYLDVSDNIDDPLTDLEKLESDSDSSKESDVSSSAAIPRARASISSLTDIEDIDISFAADLLNGLRSDVISDTDLPAPVREMIIVTEDKCGDPVSKIIPITENNCQYLNTDMFWVDKCLTDVEEISDLDDDCYRLIDVPTVEIPIIEDAVVQNCENIKSAHQRKTEFMDKEPVTETEEFFEAGTVVRKKKMKTKTQNNKLKNNKYLDVTQNVEESKTDTEEIYISDFETQENKICCSKEPEEEKPTLRISSPEQITDIEDISGIDDYDDNNYYISSDIEQKSEGIISSQEHFYSSISTTEGLLKQHGDKIDRRPSPIIRGRIFISEPNSLCPTDIEDIQLQSDIDDNPFNNNGGGSSSYSRAETISPIEIQEVLNDSLSVVHEKCCNVFNIDKEKYFIKGMKELHETHTDIEYLDEDIVVAGGGNEKINEKLLNEGEEVPTEPKPDDKKK